MADQLFPVPFYDDTLVLVAHNDEPFVAMKPIVENMGLAWQSQHIKLTEKFGSVITIIVTTGADGKQYEMICLPFRKLPAWLYSITPSKVKPELRTKIISYQNECDEVLWQYWTKGFVARPGISQPTISQQMAAHGIRLRLLTTLKNERDPAMRRAIHTQLEHTSRILGIENPAIEAIGRAEKPAADSPLIAEFWELIDILIDDEDSRKLNHSRNSGLIAINLLQVQAAARIAKLNPPDTIELRRLLKHSPSPKFIEIKTVNSRHNAGSIKCWLFEKPADEMEA